ncbi:MAG: PEP-CTERM sorting domain-containing protein [Phycisphaerae bacterium]|nr:PEP-CTERM sorting domain-containing protein [Phycisphaerae bacterium]MBN8596291.1 PEP-CTERM sorting domain-containing protein [Planctomycetota bacterium]
MLKLISGAAALAIASGASATVVYSTSFEQPAFVAGALNGQSGWLADAGSVVNNPARAHTGSQFASMTGAQIGASGKWAWENTSAIGPAQLAIAPIIRASVWVGMGGDAGTRTYTAGLDLYDSFIARIGLVYIASDGSVGVVDGANNAFNSPVGTINPNIYHKLTVEANFASQTVRFFVDNIDLGINGVFSAFDFADADIRGTRTTGTGGAAFVTAFDDYMIENDVPAPASLALLGMGLIAGGRRRR